MCELFAMSSRYPATVQMSLEEFSRHGGLAGPHKDGWGIAWYDEREIRLVKEALPAADSGCVRYVQGNPFTTPFALSHVRKATRGAVALRNCQPFVREMGGNWHCFAHNGDLPGIETAMPAAPDRFRPVGKPIRSLRSALCWSFCARSGRGASGRPSNLGVRWLKASQNSCANSVQPTSCTAMAMRFSRMETAVTKATARSARRDCGACSGIVRRVVSWRRRDCASRRTTWNRRWCSSPACR